MIDFFIPVADWINLAFDAISISISPTLRAISAFLEIIIKGFENISVVAARSCNPAPGQSIGMEGSRY